MPNQFFTHREQVVLFITASAFALGALVLLFQPDEAGQKAAINETDPQRPAPGLFRADVRGAVARPGTYAFHEGARVDDLLDAAGGILEQADMRGIDRAAKLTDGFVLEIPARPPSS